MSTAQTGRTHGCSDQCCNVKIPLANPEPSTHGPSRHFACAKQSGRFWREADINRPARPQVRSRMIHTGSRPLGNVCRPIPATDPFQYRTFIRRHGCSASVFETRASQSHFSGRKWYSALETKVAAATLSLEYVVFLQSSRRFCSPTGSGNVLVRWYKCNQ